MSSGPCSFCLTPDVDNVYGCPNVVAHSWPRDSKGRRFRPEAWVRGMFLKSDRAEERLRALGLYGEEFEDRFIATVSGVAPSKTLSLLNSATEIAYVTRDGKVHLGAEVVALLRGYRADHSAAASWSTCLCDLCKRASKLLGEA